MSLSKVHNIRFYKLKPKGINCMTYNKKEKRLAISRSDAVIEIWNITKTPHIEKTIPNILNTSIEALCWYKNRLFSVGLTSELVEYDTRKFQRKCVIPLTGGAGWCMDIHNKSKKIIVGTELGYINLFLITDEGLEYIKVFDKQDGRILCMKFEQSGEFAASGSIDTIRIWNVKTGHAIHKINISRSHTHLETVVWALTITEDFTVISGDSRGYISFWDGKLGSLIESYQSHVASVLTVCLSSNQKTLYCAGVDPIIVSFEQICIKEGTTKWIKSVQRKIYDHDVRSLLFIDEKLYSGGVDGYLACSYYPPRTLIKYPPILQGPNVSVAPNKHYILLRYHTYLELWQLGKESYTEKSLGVLQLEDEPKKLLLLQSKHDEFIICAQISKNAEWIMYSTVREFRLFTFTYDNEMSKLKRISPLPKECKDCVRAIFTLDSTQLIIATTEREIIIFHLRGEQIFLAQKIAAENYIEDTISFLNISDDGKFIVLGDCLGNLAVWKNTDNWSYHSSLPHYKNSPTAVEIQPNSSNLLVVYDDHKIVEYNLAKRRFTKFSQELNEKYPKQWQNRLFPITNITFDPRAENIIFLQDITNICIINKKKNIQKADAKIPKIESFSSQEDSTFADTSDHSFHIIKKNKHLVYFNCIQEGEMISVELNPLFLLENLPPCLEKKKFGCK